MINQTFNWTDPVFQEDSNGNRLFAYSRTKDVVDGQFFEVKMRGSAMQAAANREVIHHEEFRAFIKGFSNYNPIRGTMLNVSRWDEEQDEDVQYFYEHIDDAPIFPRHLTENISFDFEKRLYYNTISMDISVRNQIRPADKEWQFDGYPNFSALGNDFEIACIMPSDPSKWRTKTSVIDPGESVIFEKESSEAYLFAVGSDLLVNDHLIERDEIRRIVSDQLEVKNFGDRYTTVIYKEYIDV